MKLKMKVLMALLGFCVAQVFAISFDLEKEGNVVYISQRADLDDDTYPWSTVMASWNTEVGSSSIVKLKTDIDLGGRKDGLCVTNHAPLGSVNLREFDGQGYTVRGLCSDEAQDLRGYNPGFFKTVDDITVHDVNFEDVYLATNDNVNLYAGALAGEASNATFKNVGLNNVEVHAIRAGGLVGQVIDGSLNGLTASGLNIHSSKNHDHGFGICDTTFVGGAVGYAEGFDFSNVKISNSTVRNELPETISVGNSWDFTIESFIGGVVGGNFLFLPGYSASMVTTNFENVDVDVKLENAKRMGGLMGYLHAGYKSVLTVALARTHNIQFSQISVKGSIQRLNFDKLHLAGGLVGEADLSMGNTSNPLNTALFVKNSTLAMDMAAGHDADYDDRTGSNKLSYLGGAFGNVGNPDRNEADHLFVYFDDVTTSGQYSYEENQYYKSAPVVGGLVAFAYNTNVDVKNAKSSIRVTVKQDSAAVIGGLAGYMDGFGCLAVDGASFNGGADVYSREIYFGGVVGFIGSLCNDSYSEIRNVQVESDNLVQWTMLEGSSVPESYNIYMGGLIGYALEQYAFIHDSYVKGDLLAKAEAFPGQAYVGGMVGFAFGDEPLGSFKSAVSIANTYSVGNLLDGNFKVDPDQNVTLNVGYVAGSMNFTDAVSGTRAYVGNNYHYGLSDGAAEKAVAYSTENIELEYSFRNWVKGLSKDQGYDEGGCMPFEIQEGNLSDQQIKSNHLAGAMMASTDKIFDKKFSEQWTRMDGVNDGLPFFVAESGYEPAREVFFDAYAYSESNNEQGLKMEGVCGLESGNQLKAHLYTDGAGCLAPEQEAQIQKFHKTVKQTSYWKNVSHDVNAPNFEPGLQYSSNVTFRLQKNRRLYISYDLYDDGTASMTPMSEEILKKSIYPVVREVDPENARNLLVPFFITDSIARVYSWRRVVYHSTEGLPPQTNERPGHYGRYVYLLGDLPEVYNLDPYAFEDTLHLVYTTDADDIASFTMENMSNSADLYLNIVMGDGSDLSTRTLYNRSLGVGPNGPRYERPIPFSSGLRIQRSTSGGKVITSVKARLTVETPVSAPVSGDVTSKFDLSGDVSSDSIAQELMDFWTKDANLRVAWNFGIQTGSNFDWNTFLVGFRKAVSIVKPLAEDRQFKFRLQVEPELSEAKGTLVLNLNDANKSVLYVDSIWNSSVNYDASRMGSTLSLPNAVYHSDACINGWNRMADGSGLGYGLTLNRDEILSVYVDHVDTLYAQWSDACQNFVKVSAAESQYGELKIIEKHGSASTVHEYAEDGSMLLPQKTGVLALSNSSFYVDAVPEDDFVVESLEFINANGAKMALKDEGELNVQEHGSFLVTYAPASELEILKPRFRRSGNAFTLDYEADKFNPLRGVKVIYRVGGAGEDWLVDSLALESDSIVAVPFKETWNRRALGVGPARVQVKLVDSWGKEAQFDTSFVVDTMITSAPNGWQMLSLSAMNQKSFKWDEDPLFYHWDDGLDLGDYWQYQVWTKGDDMDPAAGYWYSSEEGRSIRLKDDVDDGASEVVWKLDSVNTGWNMVANPYGWRLDLSKAKNVKNVTFWNYNPETSGYLPNVKILEPYQAIWAKLDDGESVKVAVPSEPYFEPGEKAAMPKSMEKADGDDWNLQVELKDIYGKEDSWNILGKGAVASKMEEPPAAMGDHVNLSIMEGGMALAKSVKTSAEGSEWELSLSASTNRIAYLKFSQVGHLAAGEKIYVIMDGNTVEVGDGDSLKVLLSSSAKMVSVRVGEGAGVTVPKTVRGLQMVQTGRMMSVGFEVSESLAGAKAVVDVLDMDGAVVASHSIAKLSAGVNQVNVAKPKGGLYMLRVRAGSQSAAGKVLVK